MLKAHVKRGANLIGISPLENMVQTYAWGSRTAIQDLLGRPEAVGQPMAELWMGAHPKAPSKIWTDGEWGPLDEIIDRDPESILGPSLAGSFGNKLPFLFKVLAAAAPLSMQVHPDLEQAREGYARENMLGIPLDAAHRNFKDENHKSEILCALTTFHLLIGFREIHEILELMGEASFSALSGELDALKKSPDSNGLRHFFDSLLGMDQNQRQLIVHEAARTARKRSAEASLFQWISRLNRAYPGDIGVLSPLLLNLCELKPGEALYIPSGVLHAYLDGVGMELMANSDNVLRGGLTSKHVDVQQLIRCVDFKTGPVRTIAPVKKGTCETIYPTPSREFQLSVISPNQGNMFTSPEKGSAEILICTEGGAIIKDLQSGEQLDLGKGNAIIVPAAVSRYTIEGIATLYKASVPYRPVR
ncbi:MAG: mannose-6-phosphate isomerase, class I [Deltaproteobacteria bacterium]|nr:mannose-6-phosphate isomerase, class I [Deltaproteobacteria bacterium]